MERGRVSGTGMFRVPMIVRPGGMAAAGRRKTELYTAGPWFTSTRGSLSPPRETGGITRTPSQGRSARRAPAVTRVTHEPVRFRPGRDAAIFPRVRGPVDGRG